MKENGFCYYPSEKADVFDLSGAGDSFLSALVAKQLESNNIEEAIKYANKKASEIIQKRGVSVITKQKRPNNIRLNEKAVEPNKIQKLFVLMMPLPLQGKKPTREHPEIT